MALTETEYDALIEFLNRGYVRPTEAMYLQSILSKIAPKAEAAPAESATAVEPAQ